MTKTQVHFHDFPDYLTIHKIVEPRSHNEEGGSVSIEVHSKFHVKKVITLSNTWSEGYVNAYPKRWYSEVKQAIIKRYGLEQSEVRYY